MEHNKVMSGLKQTELAFLYIYMTDTSESQSFLKLTLKVRLSPWFFFALEDLEKKP